MKMIFIKRKFFFALGTYSCGGFHIKIWKDAQSTRRKKFLTNRSSSSILLGILIGGRKANTPMKTAYLIAFATITLGCSSSTTITPQDDETGGSAGTAGFGVTDAGAGNAGFGGDVSVSGSGGSEAGGTGSQPGGTGSQPSGGAGTAGTGSAPVGGEGGSVQPPSGGTGGACVPKTCLTIAVELADQARGELDWPNIDWFGTPDSCGLVDDGCGNVIDCGGCSDPHTECGIGDWYKDGRGDWHVDTNPTPNLCQGFCSRMSTSHYCGHTAIRCATDYEESLPPYFNITDATSCPWNDAVEGWCCN